MNKIKIVTDSTADLPNNIILDKSIESLPLLINFGEESYLDGTEITRNVLFQKIREGNVFPTTAQVTPQRFYETYKKLLEDGYKIISIHLSSDMSGTYQSACIAKEMLDSEDIVVIDSRNVTAGLGLLVLKAAELGEQGLEIQDIKNEIERRIPHVRSSLAFESLEYLVKGGRLSKTAGTIGSVLGIKLILEVKDGKMAVKDKVRGSKKAVKIILEELEEYGYESGEPVMLVDAENKEIYGTLKDRLIEKNINFVEAEVGCTVGIHSGPGAAGIFFIPRGSIN